MNKIFLGLLVMLPWNAHSEQISFTVDNYGGLWSASGVAVNSVYVNGGTVVIDLDRKVENCGKYGGVGFASTTTYESGVGISFKKRDQWDQLVSASPSEVPSQTFKVTCSIWYQRYECSPSWVYEYNYRTQQCEAKMCGSGYSGWQPNCKKMTCGDGYHGKWPTCYRDGRDP